MTTLRTQWQSPEVQTTLDHTNASFAANSDLSAGAQLPRYGWTSGKGEAAIPDLDSQKKADAEVPNDAPALTLEEIGRILDNFRNANPVIKIDTKDDNRDVKVCRKRARNHFFPACLYCIDQVCRWRLETPVPRHHQSGSKREGETDSNL